MNISETITNELFEQDKKGLLPFLTHDFDRRTYILRNSKGIFAEYHIPRYYDFFELFDHILSFSDINNYLNYKVCEEIYKAMHNTNDEV